jgi:hypothetical protein
LLGRLFDHPIGGAHPGAAEKEINEIRFFMIETLPRFDGLGTINSCCSAPSDECL